MSISPWLYNQLMNVYTISETQSDTGGAVETETLKHENVPCLIEILRGIERTIYGREGVVITHMIYCDLKDIIEKDRIKIGADSFDVQLIDDVQDRSHHMEIPVIERR